MKRTMQPDQEGNRTMLNQRTIFTLTHSFGRLARQTAVCAAVVALAACGGGDGGGGTDLTIIPTDQPNTIDMAASAPATPIGASVSGQLTPNDVDVFRLEIREPGRLVISATGTASTRIRAFDKDGNALQINGNVVIITEDLVGSVFVEVSAAPNAGSTSTGSYTFRTNVISDMTASSTLPSI